MDISKAKLLAIHEHSTPDQDNWYIEMLYVTPQGQHFINGRGNRESFYRSGNDAKGYRPGEKTALLSKEEANSWITEFDTCAFM